MARHVEAMVGFLDLFAIPTGTRVFRIGLLHMSINLCVTAAYIVDFLIREQDKERALEELAAVGFEVEQPRADFQHLLRRNDALVVARRELHRAIDEVAEDADEILVDDGGALGNERHPDATGPPAPHQVDRLKMEEFALDKETDEAQQCANKRDGGHHDERQQHLTKVGLGDVEARLYRIDWRKIAVE